jgi:hypothetical protein
MSCYYYDRVLKEMKVVVEDTGVVGGEMYVVRSGTVDRQNVSQICDFINRHSHSRKDPYFDPLEVWAGYNESGREVGQGTAGHRRIDCKER